MSNYQKPHDIEKRRSELRRAVRDNPGISSVKNALFQTMTRQYVIEAAQRGVFISYSRSDELFALYLDNDLRDAGVNVWMDMIDVSDEGDWNQEIEAAMQRCGMMLLTLSPAALKDKSIAAEYRTFMSAGKIVIPLMSELCDPSPIQLLEPVIPFYERYDSGLKKLLRTIAIQSVFQSV